MPDRTHRTDPLLHDQRRARRPYTTRRLRRSPRRMIGGVAAGVAEFAGVDVTVTRWIFAISVPFSISIGALGYLILWALLPGPTTDLGEDVSN